MKRLISILLSCAIVSSGCGANDTAPVSTEESGSLTISGGPEGRFATISLESWQAEPRIDPPDLPPPKKKTLVRDIRVGRGPVAQKGDRVAVYYFGVSYGEGRSLYSTWRPSVPFESTLSGSTAWEKSIEGMRVGGRREVVIPSHLAFKAGAMIYITDLVAVAPVPERGAEQ